MSSRKKTGVTSSSLRMETMRDLDEEEEEEDTSSVSRKPPDLSNTLGPSDTKRRAESPVPSCVSMKSDRSKDEPMHFSKEPRPSDTKQRAESPVPSCVSMKSDRSKWEPIYFSNDPGPSDTKQRAESPVPSCLSMKSDLSKEEPMYFSNEPGPPDTKGKRTSHVPVEEQLSSCALCQDVLKDPVSTSCGHCVEKDPEPELDCRQPVRPEQYKNVVCRRF
ncbi:hypothetical protein CgunFtcFv8_013527 [Champsocephalus gunnari]|uniref:Uncharacterized protein n=1 Tax=Champsocephalus gunnari TaxID=52237 RepID=A0AAN8DSL6_CHAGU|nr:hypothetical protein CgunFtcFv8_013527 [Champsocephalus gunnari]